MDTIILERVISFIDGMRESNSMKNLRKNGYAEGYMAWEKGIWDLIELGPAVSERKKGT